MTDEQIKKMLNGIINNDEKWEYTHIDRNGDYTPWKPYKLGNEIHDNWEYRKVEKWYVESTDRDKEGHIIFSVVSHQPLLDSNIYFEGTKEECEKWIKEHTQKTWLEEYLENYFTDHTEYSLSRKGDLLGGIRIGATEVCKKILEEVDKNVVFKNFENYEHGKALCITLDKLEGIIKDLGVKV